MRLRVFDLQGREVAVLMNGLAAAGEHSFSWDASSLPSSFYAVELRADSSRSIQKALLLK